MTLPEDNAGSRPGSGAELLLARWTTRFWAWLVDFIIVLVAVEIIFALAFAPFALSQGVQNSPGLGAARYAVQSVLFFAYWIYFESSSGQSIGKRLLKIKITDLQGNKAEIRDVAISSFGKAFLLPLDVLLGWIFTNDMRQRLLNRASNTIVIKAKGNNHFYSRDTVSGNKVKDQEDSKQ